MNGVDFCEDMLHLASGGNDGVIGVYRLDSTDPELTIANAHEDYITATLFLSRSTLVSASYDCTIRIWDIRQASQSQQVGLSKEANRK